MERLPGGLIAEPMAGCRGGVAAAAAAGSVTAAATGQGYEWALKRITELEIELQRATSGLQHAEADAAAVKEMHEDLLAAYRRLQSKYDVAADDLAREREEKQQLVEEYGDELTTLRSQLHRAQQVHDAEEFQTMRMAANWDLEAMRLRLTEEISEPLQQQIYALEGRLAAEQRKAADALRKLDVAKLEADNKEQELEDVLLAERQESSSRQQSLQRRVTSLEAEVREKTEIAAATTRLKAQLQEAEAKVGCLQQTLKEQELHSERERAELAEDLKEQIKAASESRSKAHQMQAQMEQEERRSEQLHAESESLRREVQRLLGLLSDEKAQAKSFRPASELEHLEAELAQLRASSFNEKLQAQKDAQAMQEKCNASALALERAEMRAKHLEEVLEKASVHEADSKAAMARQHELELQTLKAQLETSGKQVLDSSRSLLEREASLSQELQTVTATVKSLEEDVAKRKAQVEELEDTLRKQRQDHEEQLRKVEVEAQYKEKACTLEAQQEVVALRADMARQSSELEQRSGEVASLSQKLALAEREHDDLHASWEKARAALQRREQECEALKVEYASLSAKLDSERDKWAREADEVATTLLKVEELKRGYTAPVREDEARKQIAKTQAACKKALQKASKKRHELKQRCQELAKRAGQLQQEKATAIRICEENKAAFERHLASLGGGGLLPVSSGPAVVQTVATPASSTAATAVGVQPAVVALEEAFRPQAAAAAGAAATLGSDMAAKRREIRLMMDRMEPYLQTLRSRQQSRGPAPQPDGLLMPEGAAPQLQDPLVRASSSTLGPGGDSGRIGSCPP